MVEGSAPPISAVEAGGESKWAAFQQKIDTAAATLRDKMDSVAAFTQDKRRQLLWATIGGPAAFLGVCAGEAILNPTIAAAADAKTAITTTVTPEATATPTATPLHITAESNADTGHSTSGTKVKVIGTVAPESTATEAKTPATATPTASETSPITATTPAKAEKTATTTPVATQQEAKPTATETSQQLHVGGYTEADKADPAYESIKLLLPADVLDGADPLVPPNDVLSISFTLKGNTAINELKFPISDWLGITAKDAITTDATVASYRVNMNKVLPDLAKNAKTQGITIPDQAALKDLQILHGKLPDGSIRVVLSLPHQGIRYTDNQGTHLVDIARRFAAGQAGFDVPKGTADGLMLTAVEISGGKKSRDAADIAITAPQKIHVTSEGNATQVMTDTHTAVTGVNAASEGSTTQVITATHAIEPGAEITTHVVPEKEENKWQKEWKPNETVSVSEWWNDMVEKGYIRVDSVAEQYAGDQLNAFIHGANLVPMPKEYFTQGYAFIGNCETQLRSLELQSQGHISIDNRVYQNVPGGVKNCQIFSNRK